MVGSHDLCINTPPNSLMDSIAIPKLKTTKGKELRRPPWLIAL